MSIVEYLKTSNVAKLYLGKPMFFAVWDKQMGKFVVMQDGHSMAVCETEEELVAYLKSHYG